MLCSQISYKIVYVTIVQHLNRTCLHDVMLILQTLAFLAAYSFLRYVLSQKKKSQYLLKTKYSNSHQERYKNKTYPNSHQERYKNKLKTSQQQKKSTTLIAIARCTCYMCLWFFCTHIWRNRLCCTVFTAYRAHVAEVMSSLFQSLFWQQNLRFKHGFALILQNEILLYIYLCLLGSHVFGFQ